MTSLNFSSELKNWLGELSSRMSLVGVSCGASAGKMSTSCPLFESYLTLIRPLHVAATVLLLAFVTLHFVIYLHHFKDQFNRF